MNTIKDFEKAPVGATATHKVSGSRAMKINDGDQYWITPMGNYLSDEEMGLRGFTLDPTAPATAREALDLAWELAYEVKPGQVIPQGTQFLQGFSSGLGEYTAERDFEITPAYVSDIRTLDPLPIPEPDWLDAPAVLATMDCCLGQDVWVPSTSGNWKCADHGCDCHWSELENVTPLYPKEEQ